MKFILAKDLKNGIGKDNALPWGYCKKDMNHVMTTTKESLLVMGYNTYMSLKAMKMPFGSRKSIVLTKDENIPVDAEYRLLYTSDSKKEDLVKEIFEIAKQERNDNIFVFGGAKTYEFFSGCYEKGYVTVIASEFDCDSYLNYDVVIDGMRMSKLEEVVTMVGTEELSVWFMEYVKNNT